MQKVTNFRESQYPFYNDENISLYEKDEQVLTSILTFMRAIFRILIFIGYSLVLTLLFAICVKPAKLKAIIKVHSNDLSNLLANKDEL